MKKILIIIATCLLLCSCSWEYDFKDEKIYTTAYPIEFATNKLYSDHGQIQSVYPTGSDQSYEVTEKKKDIYSKGQTFIYSGLAKEATLAKDLLNKNGNLQIIDATKGMNLTNDLSNLWLDPSNYLMLCSNIKKGLIEYNQNVYIKEDIENNYKQLNEKVSELDVQLYNIGKNGNYNTILTTNNALNFLTKYNINVISLDKDNVAIDKAYSDAKKLISEKKISYIYILKGTVLEPSQEKLISENSLIKIEVNNLFTLTDEEKNNGIDYLSIMNEMIENYKKELYKK